MATSIRLQALRALLTLAIMALVHPSALAQVRDVDTPGPNFLLSADSPFIASGNTVHNEDAPTKINVEFGYFNGMFNTPLDYYWPLFPVHNTNFWTVQLTAYRYPFEVVGGHYYIHATFYDFNPDTGMYEHSGFDGHVGQLQ